MTLEEELKHQIEGDVHFDLIHRKVYSVDASIFEIEPLGIVVPKTKQDLIKAIKIADQFNVPVIARGAATGITGGCLGKGLIIDTSKYLNKIISIDYEKEVAIVEPGVIQDHLNTVLSEKGYRLGPDTSTGNRATIGGMFANNAAGARSLKYGMMKDHVIGVELLLQSGELIQFSDSVKGCGKFTQTFLDISKKYKKDIEEHFPKIPRRASGYNLEALLNVDHFNPCQLLTGSEGTLGIATEIHLKISKKLQKLSLVVIHLSNMLEGMKKIESILSNHPISLEMIDHHILQAAKTSPGMKGKIEWLKNDPEALFIAEFEGDKDLFQFIERLKKEHIGYDYTLITDPKKMEVIWEIRKSGLGLLLSKRSYSRAIAFIEDLSIPPFNLASFMEKFLNYLKSKGKKAGVYGHVGSGCMHIRPYINLLKEEDVKLMQEMMLDISSLVSEYKGSLSGEHGDGLIRTWLNEKFFGPRIYQAFKELKFAFDPKNLMNPGKIVEGQSLTENLRINPFTNPKKINTFLNFEKEGGFSLAVDLCNGNGLCRKPEKLMCPSFQVTQDEFHSTRARAQTLRDVVNNKLTIKDFTSKNVFEVMDLCIECKGCKTECPSEVDMAKMKGEFLYHYYKKHLTPFRNYLFANIGTLNKLSFSFKSFYNFAIKNPLLKNTLSFIGITKKRELPSLASYRFSDWVKNHTSISSDKKVILFNDTFTEFHHPEIGIAAIKILEALGYEVIVPAWKCCGRPALSKGQLPKAKKKAKSLIETLKLYSHLPIIGLEPSCLFTLKDDFESFFPNFQSKNVILFDEFIAQHIQDNQLPIKLKASDIRIKVHGHCHQKAMIGSHSTLHVLKAIPHAKIEEISSGCCGMAGSFGYEKEHYDISLQMGELKLFPAIRKGPSAIINANGFSCRGQIEHATGKKALHLSQILASFL